MPDRTRTGRQLSISGLVLVLNLACAAPAAALLCSSADPAAVPGGAVLDTIPSDTINSILNLAATPPFLTGSTSYTLTNSQPFITARTFVYNPAQPQSGSVGSFTMPLAQLRGLTREAIQRILGAAEPAGYAAQQRHRLGGFSCRDAILERSHRPDHRSGHRLVLGQRRRLAVLRGQAGHRPVPNSVEQLCASDARQWRPGAGVWAASIGQRARHRQLSRSTLRRGL